MLHPGYLSHPLPAGAEELVARMRDLGHVPHGPTASAAHESTGGVVYICGRCASSALLNGRGVTGRHASEERCAGRVT